MEEKGDGNVTIFTKRLAPERPLESWTLPQKPRRRARWLLLIFGILGLMVLGLGIYAFVRADSLTGRIFVGEKTTFFKKIQDFFRGSTGSIKLVGEDLGQVNILLLGIGGPGHDGPYLSDTLVVAQIRPDKKAVALTSVPRDFLAQLPENYGWRKINAAFAEGYYKNRDWNEGGRWAREAVEKLSGLQVPYFAVIDFEGFEDAIDQVGGLDIQIDKTFTDYTFPDRNRGYLPPVTFKGGLEHMDGARALIFSRSRHAGNGEGSDFSRSQRQQKVMKAFKAKVVSLNMITDVTTLNTLAGTFADHFHTNIGPGEIFRLYEIIKDFGQDNVFANSLDPATRLICPKILPETGAYVLTPCAGKKADDLHTYFKNAFTLGELAAEKPKVWIAAENEGDLLYKEVKKELEAGMSTVLFVRSTEPQAGTQFVQVNPKPKTAEYLSKNFGATETPALPVGFKASPEKVDLVILVAQAGVTPKK